MSDVHITSWEMSATGMLTIHVTGGGPLGITETFQHSPGYRNRTWSRGEGGRFDGRTIKVVEVINALDALVQKHPVLGKIADDILQPDKGSL